MTAESLKSIIERISKNRQAAAGAAGEPPAHDHAVRPPECSICKDRGWYTPAVPVGDPRFGRVVPCACRNHTLRADRLRRLRVYSNLASLSRFTFDTLDAGYPPSDSAEAFAASFAAAVEYCRKPSGWLVFHGPAGSGKTHLAAAIANRLIEEERILLFVSASDLLDELRSGYGNENDLSFTEIYQRVSQADLLFIDALGGSSESDWAQEKLAQIVNHRFNAALPSVFTLSCPIEHLDPHMRARLNDPSLSSVHATGAALPHTTAFLPSDSLMRRMSFESFQLRGPAASRANLGTALAAVMRFSEEPRGWLLVCGPTGVGKTHLAVAAASALLPVSGIYYSRVQTLMQRLQSAFSTRSRADFSAEFAKAMDAPVLILDDLGNETRSPWVEATLYELLAHRHDEELPTLITTSYDMAREDGPVSSRLRDKRMSTTVRIDASDYRLTMSD